MSLSFLKVQKKSAKVVQKNWILHLFPPIVQVETDEARYRVTGTGITYRMAQPLPEQLTGCPFPGLVLELAVRGFLFRHREKLPWIIVMVAALTVALYAASTWLILEHPAAGEMLQNALWTALLWTVSICATLAAVRMFQGFRNSAKYVWESELARVQETKELTAGPAPEIDLGEDILVMQKEGESGPDFEKRLAGVRMNLQDGEWALAFCFRHPTCAIWKSPTDALIIQRNEPPFQNEHWTEDQLIVPANAVFNVEQYPDFRWYCESFAYYYRAWAPAYKIESAEKGDAANTWLNTVKLKGAAMLLFLLCSFASFGQSAEAVKKATATLRVPEQGTEISYVFAKKTMGRVGNGRSNYAELLKSIPTYKDCYHGALIAIYNGETVVAKGPGAETVADAPKTKEAAMRPTSAIPAEQVPPQRGWQMPDSASNAEMAERVKFEAWRAADGAGKLGMPWIDVVFFILLLMAPALIIFGYLLRFGANFFASEGMLLPHKWCRAGLAYIVFVGVGATLLWVMILSYKLGAPVWALVIIAGAEAWLATQISKWLVPNFSPAAGNGLINRRGAYENNPHLGSGL